MASVYIEREPLLAMLFSAAEVYNRECLGYLFGYGPSKKRDHYIVTSALNLSAIVRRTNRKVQQSHNGWMRLNQLIVTAPKLYPYLGDFHSHPGIPSLGRSLALSDADLQGMTAKDYSFGVIISIMRRGKNRMEWRLKSRRTRLRGTIGRFDVHLVAYQIVRDGEGKPVKSDEGSLVGERMTLIIPRSVLVALNRAKS